MPLAPNGPSGAGTCYVIAADLSGDGYPDLTAVSPETGVVSVFSNDAGYFVLSNWLTAGKLPRSLYGGIAAPPEPD